MFIDVLCLGFEGKLADVVLGFDTLEPYQVTDIFIPNIVENPFNFGHDYVLFLSEKLNLGMS